MPSRCEWPKTEQSIRYHDEEWGVPIHDDRVWFEFLTLEGAQAGLSWETVLRKRESYREAFLGFDPHKVAKMTARDVARLMKNEGIVRNRLKIQSTITNAKAFIRVQNEFGSFDTFIWNFVGGAPKVNQWERLQRLPARTAESDALSKELKKRGFKFVGSTICYALMQATGLVNDHATSCFRYKVLRNAKRRAATSK
jgi:DNA-3-methyladenine glycosylase I